MQGGRPYPQSLDANNQVRMENLPTFRRLPPEHDPVYSIPEIPYNRKNTDIAFIIVMGICAGIQLALMIYAFSTSDIRRLVHGYDDCGNICGFDNTKSGDILCSGQDMTDRPYVYEDAVWLSSIRDVYIRRSCVSHCSGNYIPDDGHYCRSSYSRFFKDVSKALNKEFVDLIVLCFVGLGLSILSLLYFRYFVKQFIWSMLILSVLGMFAVTGFMWYIYANQSSEYETSSILGGAIAWTIISVVFGLCILFLSAAINVMAFFFKQAHYAVFSMPLILLEPILTFLSEFVVAALFVYTLLAIASAGTLQPIDSSLDIYEYQMGGVAIAGYCFSVIMAIWMVFFCLACQQMVISGAVAAYYFAVDKMTLISPVYNSFFNLVRFHLGSAAFGSLILTILRVLQILIKATASYRQTRIIYICCLRPIENLIKYLTSMGYIEISLHGQPLCKSCFRALELILHNFLSGIAMSNIGSFVFFMVKLLVVVITVLIGIAMKSDVVIVVLGGIVAMLCVHCIFVVFETAVDTIFLCYCEDQMINDGQTRPFCASVDLHNQIRKVQQIAIAQAQKKGKIK